MAVPCLAEKVEESEIRPDRSAGLHVKDGLKKCHEIAGSPIALTSLFGMAERLATLHCHPVFQSSINVQKSETANLWSTAFET